VLTPAPDVGCRSMLNPTPAGRDEKGRRPSEPLLIGSMGRGFVLFVGNRKEDMIMAMCCRFRETWRVFLA
jgi:hypothetical protein